jgi:predicted N-acetyltransferase YhbS
MYIITAERPADGPQIESLLDNSFGPSRHQKTSYRYRDGVAPVQPLCLVARNGDRVVGTIRYWPLAMDGYAPNPAPPVLLGPLAVDAGFRGQGVGLHLMHASLDMAAWARHPLAVLVGAPDYYAKAGFAPASRYGITMPNEQPERLLVKLLREGAEPARGGRLLPWRSLRRRTENDGLTTSRLVVAA